MSRNGSGTYSLPVPPFTPGTVILSADVNSDLSDIATALTGSIAADGQTTITGQLRGSQAAAPTYSITGDLNTGFGSASADSAYIQCGGTNILACTTVGATITGNFTATGTISGTISGTITATDPLIVLSTDAGAGNGPTLDLFRDSASPAISDLLGLLQFNGRNSAAAKKAYGQIYAQITDPVSTTEDANLFLQAIIAGVLTTVLQSSGANIAIPGALTVTGNIAGPSAIPTVQRFISGTAQTYTAPAGVVRQRVRMVGPGGGGSGATANNGSNSTASTSFQVNSTGTAWTALLGVGGTTGGAPGTGGTGGTNGSTGTLVIRMPGGAGGQFSNSGTAGVSMPGGTGGSTPFGVSGTTLGGNAAAPQASSGIGGGGGGGSSGVRSGSGGGGGEYVEFWVVGMTTATYTIGPGGLPGVAGTFAGSAGADGTIIVEEFYV